MPQIAVEKIPNHPRIAQCEGMRLFASKEAVMFRANGWSAVFSVLVGIFSLTVFDAAAEYPARPIRFIVSAAAGGGPDVISRLFATELSKQMGQQIVIDNRPGAAGSIGTEMIVRAAPDGYTIGYGNTPTLAINPSVLAKLPYDPTKDLQKVVQTILAPFLLAVTVSLPINSVKELIDYAKNNPGKLTFGSSGSGTASHVSGELFKLMTGVQMVHVPYKAAQQAITDMIGGRVQLMFDNMSSILPHVKAGNAGPTCRQRHRRAIPTEKP
jgi:tripartite-type tricarboxylate transporter receptor subunit TctC